MTAVTMLARPMIDNDALAGALENLLPALAEFQEIMQDAPPEVRERARPWLTHLDRATGTEETATVEDTILDLRR